MPRPDPTTIATPESRSAGGHARAAKFRAVREEAKERAIERLAGMSEKALTWLEAILEAEDDAVAYRAVRDVLDRIGARTVDHEHSGHVDVDVEISATREQLKARRDAITERRALRSAPRRTSTTACSAAITGGRSPRRRRRPGRGREPPPA